MKSHEDKRVKLCKAVAKQTVAEVLAKSEAPYDRAYKDAIVAMAGQIAGLIARGTYYPQEELENLKAWRLYEDAGGGSREDFERKVRQRAYAIVHEHWAEIDARPR